MNEEEIRFIDLFSGIGGFRWGLGRANEERRLFRRQNMHKHSTDAVECLEHGREAPGGHISQESTRSFRCVWSCDNNQYANQVYTKHFGEANHHSGDITGVDPRDIPDFDLLCAGFPCKSFSVAGKRKGFQDTRGTLFYEISRIAEAKRPQTLLLENVKGLLSNDRGQTFQTILQELGRIGYWAEWQVLNSKYHGVPQDRERVFIIGHLRNGCSRPIFPISESSEIPNVRNTEKQTASALQNPGHTSGNYRGMTMVLDAFNKGGVKEEETYALKTNPSPTSSAVVAIRPKDDWISQHAIYPSKGIGPTLRGNQNDPAPRIFDEKTRIRRLTPCECERLQGFPDGWTEWGIDEDGKKVKISDTQRYRALGNAVTTNVITFLGKRIMEIGFRT